MMFRDDILHMSSTVSILLSMNYGRLGKWNENKLQLYQPTVDLEWPRERETGQGMEIWFKRKYWYSVNSLRPSDAM